MQLAATIRVQQEAANGCRACCVGDGGGEVLQSLDVTGLDGGGEGGWVVVVGVEGVATAIPA